MMKFVRRDGELIAQPPYDVVLQDIFVFVLPADSAKLQSLCVRERNLGPSQYRPMGDFVILYGARIDNKSNDTILTTQEMGVWVPVAADDNRLLTYSPYVWIDSSTSMHVGREIFGYTKLVGDVVVPTDGQPPVLSAATDTLALRNGENRVLRADLVQIASDGGGAWSRPATGGFERYIHLAQLFGGIIEGVAHMKIPVNIEEVFSLMGGNRSVFLKQLPSAGATDGAAYQALVETTIAPKLTSVAGDVLGGKWTVTVQKYIEPNLIDNLGLQNGTTAADGSYSVPALGQAWLQFSGSLEPGKETWRGTA